RPTLCRHSPKVGPQCSSSARWDPCRGRGAISLPTAMVLLGRMIELTRLRLLHTRICNPDVWDSTEDADGSVSRSDLGSSPALSGRRVSAGPAGGTEIVGRLPGRAAFLMLDARFRSVPDERLCGSSGHH